MRHEVGDWLPAGKEHRPALSLLQGERLALDEDGPRAVGAPETARERLVGEPGGVCRLHPVGKSAEPHHVAGDPADHAVVVDQVQRKRWRQCESVG